MKKFLKYTGYTLIGIFALIGLVFTGIFVGMKFGLLNVRGSISSRNAFFTTGTKTTQDATVAPCDQTGVTTCAWNATPEWDTVKGGLQKDAPLIQQVAAETGVQARMIAAVVVPEQTRFFTSNREIFKSYFEPLKVLGSLTQFSLGVSGIKEDTANSIEQYAADPTSPFYPGDGMAALITYPTGTDHDTELFNRLTDDKSHYYQYLYTALFIKEIEAQWSKAGYPIDTSPETVVTLFNIGFAKSIPNANPQAGGAEITTGNTTYAYGELGADFYHSDELTDIFPN